jgi:hypothetical protein
LFKRSFVLLLSMSLIATSLGLQSVLAQTGSDADFASTRAKVEKLGIGREARVEVKLRDQTRLKGYIGNAEQDSFSITDKTGTTTIVRYADVSDVKKPGGLSTKSWLIIGAVVAGAVITWIAVKPVLCDGGAQTRGPC